MKKATLTLSLMLAAGLAHAGQDAPKAEPAKPATTHAKAAEPAKTTAAVKPSQLAGEIVSVSAEKKTLTFKNEKGESLTWPAEGKALESLAALKAGDKVVIAYRANEKGEPQAATEVHVAPHAKAAAHQPKPAAPAKAEKK